ncbi:MAG: tRNA (adenosine(37)-N6)-threonylcarbamoyltransferase complex dimerization subunit type 1 TsaB [Myxococcales bacterium]|nr:tRNA (adenosine(37)-N6)-threonylcarbamoyltransferase complex dimerization subunit type 1 TsaB [Myxococcales bacterium]
MRVLAVSSSSPLQTVAVAVDDVVVAEIEQPFVRRAPRRVLADIHQMLAAAGLALTDIDLLAADTGPGSFTGIRAGLATVRALGFANQIPCVGVGSLAIMAADAPLAGETTTDVWMLLPSRRTTCFVLPLQGAPTGPPVEIAYPDLAAHLPKSARLIGPAPALSAANSAHPDHFQCRRHDGPRASSLARMAATLQAGAWSTLTPCYIASTDAERNTGIYVEAAVIPALARR